MRWAFAVFYLLCIAMCFDGPLRQKRPHITIWNSTVEEIRESWDISHRQWGLFMLIAFPIALIGLTWLLV